jgi:hypothetical protein
MMIEGAGGFVCLAVIDGALAVILITSVALQATYLFSTHRTCHTVGDHPIIDGQPSVFNFTGEIYNKTAESVCEGFMLVWILMILVAYVEPVPVR